MMLASLSPLGLSGTAITSNIQNQALVKLLGICYTLGSVPLYLQICKSLVFLPIRADKLLQL